MSATKSTLTPDGLTWLRAPLDIQPTSSAICQLGEALAAAFNVSPVEALSGIVAALSLAVGSSAYIDSPFGSRLPVSLQLIGGSGTNPGFDRLLRFLCQEVLDAYAREYARGNGEDDKTLSAAQMDAEERYRAIGSELKEAERVATESPSDANRDKAKNLEDTQHETLCEFFRILRKKSLFPYGGVLDVSVVHRIVEEYRDLYFGVFGTDGAALRHLLDASPRERNEIVNFLNAGHAGEVLTNNQPRPVFPVASAVLLCPPDLIEEALAKKLHHALTGLLIVPTTSTTGSPTTGALSAEVRERWVSFVRSITLGARLGVCQRHSTTSPGITISLEPDAVELVQRSAGWSSTYTTGSGFPRSVLARAPEQILKIAALLNMDSFPPRPVGVDTVRLALEIYRWLARGAIEADTKRHTAALAREVDVLHEKLTVYGPMSRRELVRTYHKQDYTRLNSVLAEAIATRKVVHERDAFRAVPK